jgi:imidazolonepropionase-like amidohydrolase
MRIRIGLGVLTVLLIGCLGNAASRATDLALVHAKIYVSPTEPPIEDGTIVIHDGKITAVGPSSNTKPPRFARAVTVINCQGKVVTAGFWNSHVHVLTQALLHEEKLSSKELSAQMEQMFTRWGFTTVFDIASVLDNTNGIRKRIETGEVRGPRILTTGEPFWAKDGTPIYIKDFLQKNNLSIPEIESSAQAVERVRQQIHDGADGIKIFAGSVEANSILIMPLDLAKSIAAEAHREGKPVFAHPSNQEGVEVALDSGVDILAHTTPGDGPWPPSLVERLKSAHVALIPTLTLWDIETRGYSREQLEKEMNAAPLPQLRAYSEAGGEILFGTDAGYIERYDTSEEFDWMARAGMNFKQLLASLTMSPAERFGYARQSGRIAKGMDADLVVLAGDPEHDVKAFSHVAYTIRAGRIVFGLD